MGREGAEPGSGLARLKPLAVVAHQLFVNYESFGLGPASIDLVAFDLTLGFSVHVNLMSVIGVFLVAQLLRWIR